MGMLVLDTVLYMVLVWYIEGVWPGRYGVAKKFYFPLQPSYWLSQRTLAALNQRLRGRSKVSVHYTVHVACMFTFTCMRCPDFRVS